MPPVARDRWGVRARRRDARRLQPGMCGPKLGEHTRQRGAQHAEVLDAAGAPGSGEGALVGEDRVDDPRAEAREPVEEGAVRVDRTRGGGARRAVAVAAGRVDRQQVVDELA